MSIADLRRSYELAALDVAQVAADPLAQFEIWFQEALAAQLPEPNAMTLATVDAHSRPAARIVLLKGIDLEDVPGASGRGLVWYTNYHSRKGHELAQQPQAALLFHWIELERQVRIEGRVERTTDAESDVYFQSRPLQSRIGAWASPQSEAITDRSVLEAREAQYRAQFGEQVPRPPHWGGYRLIADHFEFWQGRPSRLHDRVVYMRDSDQWHIGRLAP
jgi:pyridoxamine 5'-phosphate oxidase